MIGLGLVGEPVERVLQNQTLGLLHQGADLRGFGQSVGARVDRRRLPKLGAQALQGRVVEIVQAAEVFAECAGACRRHEKRVGRVRNERSVRQETRSDAVVCQQGGDDGIGREPGVGCRVGQTCAVRVQLVREPCQQGGQIAGRCRRAGGFGIGRLC